MYVYIIPNFLNFSGSFLKKTPHISGDWFLKTEVPLFRFCSGKSSRDKRPKIPPFPRKMGIRMRPHCTFELGGGGRDLSYLISRQNTASHVISLHINLEVLTVLCWQTPSLNWSVEICKLEMKIGIHRS